MLALAAGLNFAAGERHGFECALKLKAGFDIRPLLRQAGGLLILHFRSWFTIHCHQFSAIPGRVFSSLQ